MEKPADPPETPTETTPKAAPDLPRELLWVVGGVLVLGAAILLGVSIGDEKDKEALKEDPLFEVRARARAVAGETARIVPDLLGDGRLGSREAVETARRELSDLKTVARETGVALDLSEVEAALVRVDFERALAASDLEAATKVSERFSGRPESLILEARLELARGERPTPEPLQVLADAPIPMLAEAARVLLARIVREEHPEQALTLLESKVNPGRAAAERAGPTLFLAVTKLDPLRVAELVKTLPAQGGDALRRAASLKASRRGMRLAEERPLPVQRLEDALRIVVLLGFRALHSTTEGTELATGVAQAASERQRRAQSPKQETESVLLLEHLAEAGLTCTDSSELMALADRLTKARSDPKRERLRTRLLVAMIRLDVRLFRAHLAAVTSDDLKALPKDIPASTLRWRVAAAKGSVDAGQELGKLGTQSKALGPVQRAHCLLEGGRAEPDPTAAATLIRRALTLDPQSPWVRIAFADVLAREGKLAKALDESEGAHVLFANVARGRPGKDLDELEFLRRLCMVQAHRGDENLSEVFLKTLEKKGDPQVAEIRARVAAALRRR